MAKHPAGCAAPSPRGGDTAVAFKEHNPLGTRGIDLISWPTSMAHALAYLRFDDTVTGPAARLATGWAGSPLAGRVSHPLDDYSKFREVIASLLSSSTGMARSHRATTPRFQG